MTERTTILLHPGMPKAGSTAIQAWLRTSEALLASHGFTLVVARPGTGRDLVEAGPYERGPGNSGRVGSLLRSPQTKAAAAGALAESLHRLAETHGRIVISGEALARVFFTHDAMVLGRLDELTHDHEVRVAYYVRPQHTALEAGWRQWGFRTGLPPSRYVTGHARSLHYLDTLRRVADEAPGLDFRMRPFRRDLLAGNDVVKDFAEHMLGIDPALVRGETASNVGTPLTVANLLAGAPRGLLWDSVHDNRRLSRLKRMLREEDRGGGRGLSAVLDATAADDGDARRGREVLQRWARREFCDENRALVELMRWGGVDWVPDVPGGSEDLADLDRLWTPSASPAELASLRAMLEAATRAPHRPRAAGG